MKQLKLLLALSSLIVVIVAILLVYLMFPMQLFCFLHPGDCPGDSMQMTIGEMSCWQACSNYCDANPESDAVDWSSIKPQPDSNTDCGSIISGGSGRCLCL